MSPCHCEAVRETVQHRGRFVSVKYHLDQIVRHIFNPVRHLLVGSKIIDGRYVIRRYIARLFCSQVFRMPPIVVARDTRIGSTVCQSVSLT